MDQESSRSPSEAVLVALWLLHCQTVQAGRRSFREVPSTFNAPSRLALSKYLSSTQDDGDGEGRRDFVQDGGGGDCPRSIRVLYWTIVQRGQTALGVQKSNIRLVSWPSPEASAGEVDRSRTVRNEFVIVTSESEYVTRIKSSEVNWLLGLGLMICSS